MNHYNPKYTQISDAQKAGIISPLPTLSLLSSFGNQSSSQLPLKNIVPADYYDEAYNEGLGYYSDKDYYEDDYPYASSTNMMSSQLSSHSLFNSNFTTSNSTYKFNPNYTCSKPSYSNAFNNSQKSTPIFGGSGFGNGFFDMKFGPTSYPSNIYPNNQSQPFGQSSNQFKNNNLSSTVKPLFNNEQSSTICKKIEPNPTNIIFKNNTTPNNIFSQQNLMSSSTTNEPQQKSEVKKTSIFGQSKKSESNIVKPYQFLPKSKVSMKNTFKQSSQLNKQSKTFEENKPLNPLTFPPNSLKSQTSVNQNDAKKQQQKSTIQVEKHSSLFENSFQEQQEPPQPKKQVNQEKNPINPSSSFSNSSQNSNKEQENLQQSDHSQVDCNDSPVLIDFNENPSSEDTVFIIPSNQSESAKVNELKETIKNVKKLTISQDSEQSDQIQKLRLRVKELEEMNKNYLKVIGDLSEAVKNLSIGLIQKNETEIEVKKIEKPSNKVQE